MNRFIAGLISGGSLVNFLQTPLGRKTSKFVVEQVIKSIAPVKERIVTPQERSDNASQDETP